MKIIIKSIIFIIISIKITSCKQVDHPTLSLKQTPLQIVDIYNCGTRSSYLIDVNSDGNKEKINFVFDLAEKKIKAFIYIENSVVEIPLITEIKFDKTSRYSFVLVEDEQSRGFYFTIACGTKHKEHYQYSNHSFKASTIEVP